MLFVLHNVAIGYKTHKLALVVHNRQFLNLVLLQYLGSLFKRRAHVRCHKVGNHYLAQRTAHIAFKTQVAVRDHTYKHLVGIHNRDATNVVFVHQAQCILYQRILVQRHGVDNHTVLRAFHLAHLVGLTFYRHILVQHTDTTLLSHTDGHSSLGHSVHCGTHHRNVKCDVT